MTVAPPSSNMRVGHFAWRDKGQTCIMLDFIHISNQLGEQSQIVTVKLTNSGLNKNGAYFSHSSSELEKLS